MWWEEVGGQVGGGFWKKDGQGEAMGRWRLSLSTQEWEVARFVKISEKISCSDCPSLGTDF